MPHRQLIGWFDMIKKFNRKSDIDLQANDAIKNYDLSSDVSREATADAYDRIINGTSIGGGWSRNRTRGRSSYLRGRGANRSKKQR
jgi:aspartyl-tRNA synthetase